MHRPLAHVSHCSHCQCYLVQGFEVPRSVIERNIAFSTLERYSLLLCSESWHCKFCLSSWIKCFILRERPFHIGGGGLEDFFFGRLFFSVDVKAGFFFTHHLKPHFFFTKNWRSDCSFLKIVMLGRHLFLPFCQSIIFFLQHIKAKIFLTYRLGQIIFFSQMQHQIIFSKSLPVPHNEMVTP